MNKEKIFIASKIFYNNSWIVNSAIITNNGIIEKIIPTKQLSEHQKNAAIQSFYIVPAFIDLQIYGAYGNLLVSNPTVKSIESIVEYSKKGGAFYCMPTIPTIDLDTIYKSIDAVKKYQKKQEGVLGLHIEGPWINPLKKGAHVNSFIHKPRLFDVMNLLEYGKGVIKMITLAPEVCNLQILEKIKDYGIIISAGHSNATFSEATNAFNSHVSMSTHLFNAMSQLNSREPGLVGATMQHSKAMASIIPDGIHVDYTSVEIAKKIMKERLFIITDAVTNCNKGYYRHQLDGDKYIANETLSGSALTMLQAVKNVIQYCNINLEDALQMASSIPAKLLGMENKIGKLEEGLPDCFLLLNQELELVN